MYAHPKSAKKLMILRYHPFDSQVSNRKFNIPNRQDIPMAAAMLTMIFFFIYFFLFFLFFFLRLFKASLYCRQTKMPIKKHAAKPNTYIFINK